MLYSIKKENPIDFWETLSQDQKEEIRMGIEEIQNGETIDYEDLIKKHR